MIIMKCIIYEQLIINYILSVAESLLLLYNLQSFINQGYQLLQKYFAMNLQMKIQLLKIPVRVRLSQKYKYIIVCNNYVVGFPGKMVGLWNL